MTVAALLGLARDMYERPVLGQTYSPQLDSRLLLASVMGVHPDSIPARLREETLPGQEQAFLELWQRRISGAPVAYLLGLREFWGMEFEVGPGVLVPRPETETLVEWVLSNHPKKNDILVLDLCTGSACIAVSLAVERPSWRISAADISPQALEFARRNVAALAPAVALYQSDLFADLPDAVCHPDILVANPPYVEQAVWQGLDKAGWQEPELALASGEDGLDLIRRLVQEAAGLLAPGAYLYIEHGSQQAFAVQSLMLEAGFSDTSSKLDLAGKARICRGIR